MIPCFVTPPLESTVFASAGLLLPAASLILAIRWDSPAPAKARMKERRCQLVLPSRSFPAEPSTNQDGLYAAGLRFGEQRVMAILAALVGFCFLIRGFTNRQLVERVRALLQSPYTSRQATYDLRRLKRKGVIAKIQGTHRYQLTGLGRRVAVLFTKAYRRVLAPGLSALDPRLPEDVTARSDLTMSWRGFERALDKFI